MRKIPTIYQRDPATNLRHVKNEHHPDCGWVFDGEGEPTFKWDGTAVLITADATVRHLWKRREVKAGKAAPDGFRQEGAADPNTGKRVGWVRCNRDDPADRWHFEAVDSWLTIDPDIPPGPGTYELVGPKVQGNPHGRPGHELHRHGKPPLHGIGGWFGQFGQPPIEFEALADWLRGVDYPGFEGIVWHHPDGRMAKIKVRDFPAPNEP